MQSASGRWFYTWENYFTPTGDFDYSKYYFTHVVITSSLHCIDWVDWLTDRISDMLLLAPIREEVVFRAVIFSLFYRRYIHRAYHHPPHHTTPPHAYVMDAYDDAWYDIDWVVHRICQRVVQHYYHVFVIVQASSLSFTCKWSGWYGRDEEVKGDGVKVVDVDMEVEDD